MRYFLPVLLAGLLWAWVPGKSQAWGRWGYGYAPSFYGYPGYYAPPVYGSAAYVGPYGYRSFYNFSSYPTPYGSNTAYNYGAWQQPYVSAPYYSIYFNPYLNTYQYGTGYLNTPTFSYFYGY
jgi:hypothetical protein